jgi:two-component system, response regulator YesN
MWKIAIVDDDFQVLRGLKKAIPWEECDAECAGEASNGESGLELIRSSQPDIVITDLYMPGISGIEMIEQARKEGFQGRFIILSGYSDFEYARQALRLGVEDYLMKPGTLEQIREVLERTIGKLEESYLLRLEEYERNQTGQITELSIHDWVISMLNNSQTTLKQDVPPHVHSLVQWEEHRQAVAIMEVIKTDRVHNITIADWNLFRFALTNVAQESLAHAWPGSLLVWLYGSYFAVVYHVSNDLSEPEALERIHAVCRQVSHNVQQYLGISVRYGIGDMKTSWRGLKESSEEAFQELFMRSMDSVLSPASKHGSGQLSVTFCRQLASALQTQDPKDAMSIVSNYLDAVQADCSDAESTGFYRVLATEVWALFQYAAAQAGIRPEDSDPTVVAYELDQLTGRVQLEEWLASKIDLIHTRKQPQIGQKHKQAVEFMIQYIHEHYAEDLTLEDLSNQLFISKNYLNQLFKKVTGETFMNYVIRVRINKAKVLLLEGNLMIYEIAEKVGYQNVPYFSTLFKKYCGVNPSDLIKK